MPHVVHYRVPGGHDRGDNVNEVEAETIASLICAAMEQPEYGVNHERESKAFDIYRSTELTDERAHDLLIRLFDAGSINITEIPYILEQWRKG
jgi:hypothetical protein